MSKNSQIHAVLGENVKTLRIQQGLTREMLSEMLDVSSRFLADVESGKVGVSLTTLKKLCLTLGISADHLLGLSEEDDDDRREINTRIMQIPNEYLPQFKQIVSAFSQTVHYLKH